MRAFALLTLLTLACEPSPPGERPRTGEAVPEAAPTITTSAAADGAVDSVPTPFLDRYDFADRLRRADLPGRLDEISGLAFTPDGRLFAHDDERGRVHEIDPLTLAVGKHFDLGQDMARDDFEGIAVVGERFFLVSSGARLYEFREGGDGENVAYRVTDTGVGRGCEVEGLDWEPMRDELLLACKTVAPDRGDIVVHRIPVQPDRERPPPLRISRAGLGAVGIPHDFAPSAIAVTPGGSWLLLSGRQEALIEVDTEGRILAGVALSDGRHPQPEGLAIGPDGTLYISDEKNGKEPRLTAYGPR